MNDVKSYGGIEYRARTYDSTVEASKKSFREMLSDNLWRQVERWTVPNDQICLTRITDRGVKEVVSTGVTKELLEKYIANEKLSTEDLIAVKTFLHNAIDIDLLEDNEEKMHVICKLILEAPDQLDFIKKLSSLPDDKVLLAFSINIRIFQYIDLTHLNKIISLEDAPAIIKILSERPLWRLNRNLLGTILNMPNPSLTLERFLTEYSELESHDLSEAALAVVLSLTPESFASLSQTPGFFDEVLENAQIMEVLGRYPEVLPKLINELKPDVLAKVLNNYSLLEALGKYSESLRAVEASSDWGPFTPILSKILESKDPVYIINILPSDFELLNHERFTTSLMDKILESTDPGGMFDVLMSYHRLLNNSELSTELLEKIALLENPSVMLKTINKYFFRFPKISVRPVDLAKILESKDSFHFLNLILSNFELLKHEKFTTSLVHKILESTDPDRIFYALKTYPQLLNNSELSTELLEKIALHEYPGVTLGAINKYFFKYPEISDRPFNLAKILESKDPVYFLNILVSNFELLKHEKFTISLVNKILESTDPDGMFDVLKTHPQLLNNSELSTEILEKIALLENPSGTLGAINKYIFKYPKISDRPVDLAKILESKDSVYILNVLVSNFEWVKHEKLVYKMLESTDPDGMFDVLKTHPQLLNNSEISTEILEKIALLENPSGMLKTINKSFFRYSKIFDMPANTFVKLAEKLIFLDSRGCIRINEILEQVENQESVPEIESQLNQLISKEIDRVVYDLKTISDPILFQLERSKRVGQLLINNLGELNLFLIDELKEKMPKSASPVHDKEFNETLDKLKNNRKLASILTSINIPADRKNKASVFIRATLQLGVDAPYVNVQQVRQCALSALLMDLRQSMTGSCFSTAVSIRIHSTEQERFLKDMKDMIENGYTTKTVDGTEHKLLWSTIPPQEIGYEDPFRDSTKKATLAALGGLGYTLSEAQEIYKVHIENPTELSPKNPRDLIEKLAAEKLGISQEAINERKKMEELTKPDEQAIPILSSRVKLVDKRFDAFDDLINYAEGCFTATSHNLLLRGWEYGLAATGRIIASIGGLSDVRRSIYQFLWGESASTRKHYGIDTALSSLTDKTLESNKSLSDDERDRFKQKLSAEFASRYENLFYERVKPQYQYGGFSLYDARETANLSEIQMISALADPIELQDLVARLVLETGFELRKEFGKEYSELITQIAAQLSQHVRSDDFLEHYIRSISGKIEADNLKMKPEDRIPETKIFKRRFNSLIEGGSLFLVLRIFYLSMQIRSTSFVARDAEDLLVHFIMEARKLGKDKNEKVLIPVSGPNHGYLFMPNHPSFRDAIDSDLDPEEWVNQHVRKNGETIIFADSNWETNGVHRMFAIRKNESGGIVFSTVDEIGHVIAGGVDSFGMNVRDMDQDEWVNNKTFSIYPDLP